MIHDCFCQKFKIYIYKFKKKKLSWGEVKLRLPHTHTVSCHMSVLDLLQAHEAQTVSTFPATCDGAPRVVLSPFRPAAP